MNKELYVSSTPHETKVALVEDDQLAEVFFERENEYTLAGSIYKGRVTRVLPGMQSAFVDIGLERDAFLYVSDFLEVTGDEEDEEEFGSIPVPRNAIDVSKAHAPRRRHSSKPSLPLLNPRSRRSSKPAKKISLPAEEQTGRRGDRSFVHGGSGFGGRNAAMARTPSSSWRTSRPGRRAQRPARAKDRDRKARRGSASLSRGNASASASSRGLRSARRLYADRSAGGIDFEVSQPAAAARARAEGRRHARAGFLCSG